MEYRRSIFIINKRFQFRFALYVCSWLFALSLIYPAIIYNLFDLLLRHAEQFPQLRQLQDVRGEVLWLLGFLQLLFLAVTLIISIFVSHRIAGPLYKLNRFMKEAAGGTLAADLKFRKADHFKELAESYNQMMGTVLDRIKKKDNAAQTAAEQIREAIDHADTTGQQKLREALALLETAASKTRT